MVSWPLVTGINDSVSGLDLFSQVSQHFRAQRKQRFVRWFALGERSGLKILDLGGTPWSSFLHDQLQHQVCYLNQYNPANLPMVLPPGHSYLQADARSIPVADDAFDIVFSNSVIEHVGHWADQEQVAREIQRVGQGYWIQTPYKHFPIEPHYNFPGFQYLPEASQRWIHQWWPLSWVKRHRLDYEPIALLNVAQMGRLFPEANLYYERWGGLIKSLVAYRNPVR